MLGMILQYICIIIFHDFNPALTPGVMEDSTIFDTAYAVMNIVHG